MDLKRRFTFFKSKRVDEALEVCSTDQILGQKIGSVDVQCTFKARESRWTTKSETELHGLLLFNIQFTDYSNTPLRTAIITIDVDAFDSKGPKFVIDESAPINPITGPAIEQSIRDDKKFDPDIGAGVGPGSFNASGVSYEKETETTAVHRWTFNSGFPSQKQGTRIYKAGFFWTRTLLADRSGTRRSYEGALVVNCSKEYTTPLSLDVQVKIKPWHRHHSFLNGGSRRKKSEPVGPSEKSLTSRETLLPTPYEDLQSYMKWRNSRLAPTRKSKLPQAFVWSSTTYTYQRLKASESIASLKTSYAILPRSPTRSPAPRRDDQRRISIPKVYLVEAESIWRVSLPLQLPTFKRHRGCRLI